MKINFIERGKRHFSIQVAFNRVINNFDTSKIEAIIKKYPEESHRVAQRAIFMCENFDTWPSLLLAICLIQINSAEAINIIKKLIQHNDDPVLAREKPVRWDRLDLNQLKHIINYLRINDPTLVYQFYRQLIKRLPEEQLFQLVHDMNSSEFISFSKAYIENNKPLDHLRNSIVDYLEKATLWGIDCSPIFQSVLINCRDVARIMWNSDKVNDAMEIFTVISLIDSSYLDKNMIACIADSLDCCEGLSLVRAVQLLKDFASEEWDLT